MHTEPIQDDRIETIADILPLVEQPSRYLGNEINHIRKDPSLVDLKMVLAFPDLYEIGMSHFGMQILYSILNARSDILAERVFAPANDMAAHLKSAGIPLSSLENRLPLSDFDIIGFSLLYELNATNILFMLDLAGIAFYAEQRDENAPLIVAGGPGTCNPEPVAPFFDAMLIGDGEEAIVRMADAWLNWKTTRQGGKAGLLKAWADIEGVYVPSLYQPVYDVDGSQQLVSMPVKSRKVRRTILADLDQAAFPVCPILPYGRPVHDRLRLEVVRGCTRGCRFCQAGMIYRPVRERSPQTLLKLAADCIASTGYEDMSLLSLSTGDYHCIAALLNDLMLRYGPQHYAVSLPSLRAGTLTPELVALIKQVRKTGFTIAPEAGSQRLRDVINKNISTSEIHDTVKTVFSHGWRLIKLYFMVGLPTETDADLEAIVELVNSLARIKPPGGKRKPGINVSVATFIPKPQTPFQWSAQVPLDESKRKIEWLQRNLRQKRIQFKWQNPEVSWLEGLMARGDRRLAAVIADAYRNGCRFDGWSDQFRFDRWQKVIADAQIDTDQIMHRQKDIADPLPWDHVDQRIDRDFLVSEWQKAQRLETTPDCRFGACQDCGVCDFDALRPNLFSEFESALTSEAVPGKISNNHYHRVQIYFSKTDDARFLGHLEMLIVFMRALRRVAVDLKFSQGFHPKPKVSFSDPLPIGMESEDEQMTLSVAVDTDLVALQRDLNAHLPPGIRVNRCSTTVKTLPDHDEYRIEAPDPVFDQHRLREFEALLQAPLKRYHRKKKTFQELDLKQHVIALQQVSPIQLRLTLHRKAGQRVRPSEAVAHIYELPQEVQQRLRIVKLAHRC